MREKRPPTLSRPRSRSRSRRLLGELAGVATGVVTGLALVPVVLLGWAGRARRGTATPPFTALTVRAARLERARLIRFLGAEIAGSWPAHRALPYLSCRVGLAVLGALTLATLVIGLGYGSLLLWGWALGSPLATVPSGIGGTFLASLTVLGVSALVGVETRLAHHFLGPSEREALRHRITQLADSRAGVVEAITEERRRIERDLHDGVQQRLVALGLALSRAQRSPERAAEHLGQARKDAALALAELREVAWRVYPTVLDEAGLGAALETLAERCPLPVRLRHTPVTEPPRPVATAGYFVVCEAVTNAVKHADAAEVTVTVTGGAAEPLTLRVADDGRGGADPAGGGLLGLARRVAALDGRLDVHSPPGGPTVITAELPCD